MASEVAKRAPLLTVAQFAEAVETSTAELSDVVVHDLATDGRGALGLSMTWTSSSSAVPRAGLFRLTTDGNFAALDAPRHTLPATAFRDGLGQCWGAIRTLHHGKDREMLIPLSGLGASSSALPAPVIARPFVADRVDWSAVTPTHVVRLLTNRSHRRLARLLTHSLNGGDSHAIVLPHYPYPTDCFLGARDRIDVLSRNERDIERRSFQLNGELQSLGLIRIGRYGALRPLSLDETGEGRFVAADGASVGIVVTSQGGESHWQEMFRLPDPGAIVHSLGRPRRWSADTWSLLFSFGGSDDARSTGNGWMTWTGERLDGYVISGFGETYRDQDGRPVGPPGRSFLLRSVDVSAAAHADLFFTNLDPTSQTLLVGASFPRVTRLGIF